MSETPGPAARIRAGEGTRPEEVLESVFGFRTFRGSQEAIVRRVTDGGDALVVMPTGSGKSLCYQIPSILRPGVGLVVSPLIALMNDQVPWVPTCRKSCGGCTGP